MSSFLGKISEKYVSLSSQVDVYRNIKGFKFNCMLTFLKKHSEIIYFFCAFIVVI